MHIRLLEKWSRVEASCRNLLADLVLITTDIPTLLCIASGIAIFTGMICFVLKLFSRARYSRPRHYANANHPPPMLFSSDTGEYPRATDRPSPEKTSLDRFDGGERNDRGRATIPPSFVDLAVYCNHSTSHGETVLHPIATAFSCKINKSKYR